MSDFALEEWEQAIEMPSPFKSAVWESARLQFRFVLAKRDKWVVFVREKGQPQSPSWLILHYGGVMPQFYSVRTSLKTWQTLEMSWPKVPKGYFFAWPRMRCIVLEEGHGHWLDSKLQASRGFFLKFKSSERVSSRARWERVEQEFQLEDSDLSFAYRSRNVLVTPYEQFALLYESRAQYDEINRLARFVLMGVMSNVQVQGARWNIGQYSNATSVWVYNADDFTQNWVKLALVAWSQFLEEWVHPLTWMRREKHYSLKHHPWSRNVSLAVEVETKPTAHERLEARLYVRDWLQRNAPDRMDLLDVSAV